MRMGLYAASRGARVGSLQECAQLQLNIEKNVKKKKEKEQNCLLVFGYTVVLMIL